MSAHTRLRKFETNQWYRGQQTLNSELCMVVKSGNWLAIRGQTGHDLVGDFHGLGDPAEQTRQAIRNLTTLMAEGGATFQDICKVKVWVIDRAYIEPVHAVLAEAFRGIHIAMNTVVITGLARVYMDMEIDVYAVIDHDDPG